MSPEVAAALDALDLMLRENRGGYPDDALLSQIRRHLHTIRLQSSARAKANEIEGWCEILFSRRIHPQGAGSPEIAAERVRGFVLADLSTLRSIVSRP